jgi:uncharacterized membrane protein
VSTNRLEAFSDGVIAVAITLLVLDITVPAPSKTPHLAHALGQNWPHYFAYVVSFATIGIIWINHHAMIARLRETDHTILLLNNALLLTIAVLPFATSLMATYLKEGHGQSLAAAIYSGLFLLMSVSFMALNRYILIAKADLMREPLPEAERRRLFARGVTGSIPYAVATALAPVSAYVTVIICGAIAVFYALPVASGSDRRSPSVD